MAFFSLVVSTFKVLDAHTVAQYPIANILDSYNN